MGGKGKGHGLSNVADKAATRLWHTQRGAGYGVDKMSDGGREFRDGGASFLGRGGEERLLAYVSCRVVAVASPHGEGEGKGGVASRGRSQHEGSR